MSHKTLTSLHYALQGDLTHDPTVASHYSAESDAQMNELYRQLEIVVKIEREKERTKMHSTTEMTAYRVDFFRAADGVDCTNGGVSSKHKGAILYRGSVPVNHPTDLAALILDARTIAGRACPRAVPAGERGRGMFGGNFVWSTDSRFRNEVCDFPIPVHDRVEDSDHGGGA